MGVSASKRCGVLAPFRRLTRPEGLSCPKPFAAECESSDTAVTCTHRRRGHGVAEAAWLPQAPSGIVDRRSPQNLRHGAAGLMISGGVDVAMICTGEPIRRHEHDHPGALLHVGVKRLGNIPDGGQLALSRPGRRPKEPGGHAAQAPQPALHPDPGHRLRTHGHRRPQPNPRGTGACGGGRR
jgi:hypothetical protein